MVVVHVSVASVLRSLNTCVLWFGIGVAQAQHQEGVVMAKNTGHGSRKGAVRQRSQTQNPQTGTWLKRGPNGQFMDGKSDGTPFKGVRKEK